MAIEIELLAKTVQLIKGSKDSAEALDGVKKGLDELGDEGVQMEARLKQALDGVLAAELEHARKSTQTFEDMTRAQQDAFRARFDSEEQFARESEALSRRREQAEKRVLEEHERRVRETYDEIGTTAEDSARRVARASEDGFDKAKDSAKGLGSTVSGELGDAFRTFDGTAEGAVESVVETLRGLTVLAPGFGALIGAALGVAGTELARSIFDGADRSKDRVNKLYEDLLEAGTNYRTEEQNQEAVRAALQDEDMRKRAESIAEAFGIPFEKAIAIIVENGDEAKKLMQEIEDEFSQSTIIGEGITPIRAQELNEARTALEQVNDEFRSGLQITQETRRALSFLPSTVDESRKSAEELNAELDRTETRRIAHIGIELDSAAVERELDRIVNQQRRVRLGVEVGGRIIR